jgi:hypothetical protein
MKEMLSTVCFMLFLTGRRNDRTSNGKKQQRAMQIIIKKKVRYWTCMDDFTLNELNIKDDSANVARHVCAGV